MDFNLSVGKKESAVVVMYQIGVNQRILNETEGY